MYFFIDTFISKINGVMMAIEWASERMNWWWIFFKQNFFYCHEFSIFTIAFAFAKRYPMDNLCDVVMGLALSPPPKFIHSQLATWCQQKWKTFFLLLTFDISSPMVHRDKAWSIPLRTALCERVGKLFNRQLVIATFV